MFKIYESYGIFVNTESRCATLEAATRRLKMLRKRNPEILYWIQEAGPKVTVLNHSKVSVTTI